MLRHLCCFFPSFLFSYGVAGYFQLNLFLFNIDVGIFYLVYRDEINYTLVNSYQELELCLVGWLIDS